MSGVNWYFSERRKSGRLKRAKLRQLISKNDGGFSNSLVRRLLKPSRLIFQDQHNRFISHENDFDDDDEEEEESGCEMKQDEKSFQDGKVKLFCIGDCGSKMMTFLLNHTNLKILKDNQSPRENDIVYGRAREQFYEKLSFESEQKETEFCSLFAHHTQETAANIEMGSFHGSYFVQFKKKTTEL